MTDARYTIVLGDDHHLMVEALRSALNKAHRVVAVAYTAAEILDAVHAHRPDLLLLDLSLPERNGFELIPELRTLSPATCIIVVTMHLDRLLADRALAEGARGFLPKDAGLEELEHAIRIVMGGATFISPRVPRSTNRVTLSAEHKALALLTPRQHEVITLVASGRTSQEIATRLGLTVRTVGFHRANIRAKLGVDSAHDLMQYALLLGLDDVGAEETQPAGVSAEG